jgi:hypothetical protein
VIQVRDLGKLYRIRSTERQPYSNLREDLVNGIKRFVGGILASSSLSFFVAGCEL